MDSSSCKEFFKKIKVSSNDEAEEKIIELSLEQEGSFICKFCGYNTRYRANLTKHIPTHFEGIEYKCSFCDKVFNNKSSIYQHTLRHRDEVLGKDHKNLSVKEKPKVKMVKYQL